MRSPASPAAVASIFCNVGSSGWSFTACFNAVLKSLCDLFALYHLDKDRGWFQEQGYFESSKARAVHKQVETLGLEVRPLAGALVDAFAIPDELLGAPIALRG